MQGSQGSQGLQPQGGGQQLYFPQSQFLPEGQQAGGFSAPQPSSQPPLTSLLGLQQQQQQGQPQLMQPQQQQPQSQLLLGGTPPGLMHLPQFQMPQQMQQLPQMPQMPPHIPPMPMPMQHMPQMPVTMTMQSPVTSFMQPGLQLPPHSMMGSPFGGRPSSPFGFPPPAFAPPSPMFQQPVMATTTYAQPAMPPMAHMGQMGQMGEYGRKESGPMALVKKFFGAQQVSSFTPGGAQQPMYMTQPGYSAMPPPMPVVY